MFKSILILCTGNICRSPMAEALLRARLEGTKKRIASAGMSALVGYPADPLAVELCRGKGLDLTAHRAQQATPELLSGADLILTMSQDHNDWIHRYYPQLRGRAHKWLRWHDKGDVVDPYRRPRAVYERALADIELGLADWLPRIKR